MGVLLGLMLPPLLCLSSATFFLNLRLPISCCFRSASPRSRSLGRRALGQFLARSTRSPRTPSRVAGSSMVIAQVPVFSLPTLSLPLRLCARLAPLQVRGLARVPPRGACWPRRRVPREVPLQARHCLRPLWLGRRLLLHPVPLLALLRLLPPALLHLRPSASTPPTEAKSARGHHRWIGLVGEPIVVN